MTSTNLFVITGGPGAGKTTLLNALKAVGYCCSEEAGRRVIQQQIALGGHALPWLNPALFAENMFELDMQAYRSALHHPGPCFFDRGLPDLVGYLGMLNLPVPSRIQESADGLRYNRRVFVAPPWPEIFTNDAERRQSLGEAERTCQFMVDTYSRCGYELVELPRLPVEDRVSFIVDAIGLAKM